MKNQYKVKVLEWFSRDGFESKLLCLAIWPEIPGRQESAEFFVITQKQNVIILKVLNLFLCKDKSYFFPSCSLTVWNFSVYMSTSRRLPNTLYHATDTGCKYLKNLFLLKSKLPPSWTQRGDPPPGWNKQALELHISSCQLVGLQ